jgi:hypothetical protein
MKYYGIKIASIRGYNYEGYVKSNKKIDEMENILTSLILTKNIETIEIKEDYLFFNKIIFYDIDSFKTYNDIINYFELV